MTDPSAFTKFVPGFEFLQGLVKNAGAALPGLGQWVAPTLNPEELEKKIDELRTVQFWLEQNARLLGATIQALEVQRMTLSTLQSMNVPLADLRDALKVPTAFTAPDAMAAAWPSVSPELAAAAAKAMPTLPKVPAAAKPEKPETADAAAAPSPTPAIDPMQWWGALSQQFTQLAANAMKDTTADAAKNLAGSLVQQSIDVASETMRKAATSTGTAVGAMANTLTPKVAKPKVAPASKTSAKPAAARKRTR